MQSPPRAAIDPGETGQAGGRQVPRAYLWIGLLSAALVCLYLGFLLTSPSDGARISKAPGAFSSRGVILHVFQPQPGGLQDGDLLLAIDGRPAAEWPIAASPAALGFRPGQTPVYTIERGGETLEVRVPLAAQPLGAMAAEHWSLLLYPLVAQLIGVFMLWQRPHIPAARALYLWGVTSSHIYIWSSYYQPSDLYFGAGVGILAGTMLFFWVLSWPASLQLVLVFPEPLPLVQRRPWLIPALYPLSALVYLLLMLFTRLANPLLLDWMNEWRGSEVLLAILFLAPTMAALAAQYRRHRFGRHSKSIQWILLSALFGGGVGLVLYIIPELLRLPGLGVAALGLVMLPLPVLIALAILRFHLFDIELILNRALVYSALTALLGAIYLTSIVVLQSLVGATLGNTAGAAAQLSPLVVVVSTLLAAALFNPLRRRVQDGIDRRYYRRKYNSEQVVQAFGEQLRQQIDFDSLTGYILATVEETLQPETASLWLRTPPAQPAGVEQGDDSPAA